MTIQTFVAGQTLTASQMNTLQASDFNSTRNVQSGTTYSLVANDVGKLIEFTNNGSITFNIPTNATVPFNVGDRIDVLLASTGNVTISPVAGVTVNAEGGLLNISSQWSKFTLIKRETNSWVVTGAGMQVQTVEIENGAVTTAKLADGAVTQEKLATGTPQAGFRSVQNAATTASSNYTVQLTDLGKLVELNEASACTLTVPTNASVAFAVGDRIDVLQVGAGQVTITPVSGTVTINGYDGGLKLNGQWAAATLIKRATNTWVAVGNLTT